MYGDNICIEYDFSVIPELQEETDKVVDQMSKAWWLTPNEKRAAMSYAHDEDNPILDEYYIPANLIPASGSDIDFADPQPLADEDSKKKNPISNIEVKDSIELKASYNDYPQSASNNAKRMIDWREKYGRDEVTAGTSVGWQRASSLSKRESLSESTVARMAQFNRHRENATIDPKFKDTPWKDNGYVAWNLWGGTSGVNWAIKKIKQIRDE
jgi:hypothetical protein